jgi:hypothetical protein
LGTTACALKSSDVLAGVLMQHVDRVVELYVYNSTTDIVRVVGLLPTYSWGDHNSLLGAEVGTGYLHRLPTSCRGTIGQSIERKVQVLNGDGDGVELNQEVVRMEPHLEMEVDDKDSGPRTEASTKQPHQLGIHDRDIMAGSLDTQESMRSISLASEAGGEILEQYVPSDRQPAESQLQSTGPPRDQSAHMAYRIPDGNLPDDAITPQLSQQLENLTPFPDATPVNREQENLCPPPLPVMPVPPPPPQGPTLSTPLPPPLAQRHSDLVQQPPPPDQPSSTPKEESTGDDEGEEESETDDQDDSQEDEEDSEEGEYELEGEEEQDNASPKKGGFFSSFMPAPPKMHY